MNRLIACVLSGLLLCVIGFWPARAAEADNKEMNSQILVRAAEMKNNFEGLDTLSAVIAYEFTSGEESTLWTLDVKWAKPDRLLVKQLNCDSETWPLLNRASDCKQVTVEKKLAANNPKHKDSGRILAEISHGTGTLMDAGVFVPMDPRLSVWGMPDNRTWQRLSEAVQSGIITSVQSEEQFGVRGLAVESTVNEKIQDYLWIDDAHGSMPRIWRRQTDGFESEIRVHKVEESGGVWFPVKLVKRINQAGVSDSVGRWEISSLVINKDIPNETFQLDLKPGTEVTDRIRNRRYVVGQTPSWIFIAGVGAVIILGLAVAIVLRRRGKG